MPPSITAPDNRKAIVLMLLAMASFVFNDAASKLASAELGTGQIILVRGLIASPIIILAALWQGAFRDPSRLFHRAVTLRTVGEVVATGLYLTALFNMPIANSTAILQTVPLATTAAAALILGEAVGIRRWSAIAVGFAGVLLIVRPGSEGFNIWSLFALASVGAILLRDLSSRLVPAEIPAMGAIALSSVMVTVLGGLMTLFGGWRPISEPALLYLFISGIFLIGGYYFMLEAMRTGEISAIAPFRYTILLWAIVLQIVLFGVWPDWMTILGSAILVATGIYTLYRERVVRGDSDEPPIAAQPPHR